MDSPHPITTRIYTKIILTMKKFILPLFLFANLYFLWALHKIQDINKKRINPCPYSDTIAKIAILILNFCCRAMTAKRSVPNAELRFLKTIIFAPPAVNPFLKKTPFPLLFCAKKEQRYVEFPSLFFRHIEFIRAWKEAHLSFRPSNGSQNRSDGCRRRCRYACRQGILQN